MSDRLVVTFSKLFLLLAVDVFSNFVRGLVIVNYFEGNKPYSITLQMQKQLCLLLQSLSQSIP